MLWQVLFSLFRDCPQKHLSIRSQMQSAAASSPFFSDNYLLRILQNVQNSFLHDLPPTGCIHLFFRFAAIFKLLPLFFNIILGKRGAVNAAPQFLQRLVKELSPHAPYPYRSYGPAAFLRPLQGSFCSFDIDLTGPLCRFCQNRNLIRQNLCKTGVKRGLFLPGLFRQGQNTGL